MKDPNIPSLISLTGPSADIPITEDDTADDEPTSDRIDLTESEISDIFSEPSVDAPTTYTPGMAVDVYISKTWRHGKLTQEEDGFNRVYVKGKGINRRVNKDKLRPCACETHVSIPKPTQRKAKPERRSTRIYHRMYHIQEK
jgi:hypothetical protein